MDMWMCGGVGCVAVVWRRLAASGSVWRCVVVCGGSVAVVWRHMAACGGVWWCVAVCSGVFRCVAVCGGVGRYGVDGGVSVVGRPAPCTAPATRRGLNGRRLEAIRQCSPLLLSQGVRDARGRGRRLRGTPTLPPHQLPDPAACCLTRSAISPHLEAARTTPRRTTPRRLRSCIQLATNPLHRMPPLVAPAPAPAPAPSSVPCMRRAMRAAEGLGIRQGPLP